MATKAKIPGRSVSIKLSPPAAARQVRFYQLLLAARKQWFVDGLRDALANIDPLLVKSEISIYVPIDLQKLLATAGIRDEFVFPIPEILKCKPSLVGYYRLLLGASQKAFYAPSTGLSAFKPMEEKDVIPLRVEHLISEFCHAMIEALAELVRQIPNITERDLQELPLLTFGSQLQGSNNTQIGKTAMNELFVAVKSIVQKHIITETPTQITLRNSSKRVVFITLSHDPDLSIREQVGNQTHLRIAIEVKGGTDVSNAHNRAGEAEKSHQKSKQAGFTEFWTIISKQSLNVDKLRGESPTTNHWFDIVEILRGRGTEWDDFRGRLTAACGIPLATGKKRPQHS